MTKYQGCKCPICQKPFTNEDDIVVCPECGAPYHRSCWKEHGGCVFADRHAEGFEDHHPDEGPRPLDSNGPVRSIEELPCPICGANNPASNIFCESCGAPMHGMSVTPPSPFDEPKARPGANTAEVFAATGISPEREFDGIKASEWATYLGRSAPYYLMAFQRMDQSRHKIFPSLSGFFLGPLFLLYRKVWSWGFVSAAVSLLCSIPMLLIIILASHNPSATPAEYLMTAQQVCSFISLGIQILLFLFSFYLIRLDGAKKIKKMKEQASSAQEFQQMLGKKSAPSWVGIGIFFLVVVLISIVLVPFFGPYLSQIVEGQWFLF